ncbi:MAG: HAMP domain-containing sensor histidine kinase [Verrucomicrobiota bacterium]
MGAMLRKEIQMNSRQLRTLVVLMLLLPILPIGIMARFMVHSVVEERMEAVEASKRVYLAELQRTTEFVRGEIEDGELERPRAGDVESVEPLAVVYRKIFGDMMTIRLIDPEGFAAVTDVGRVDGGEQVSVVLEGVLEGWTVELSGVGYDLARSEFYGQLLEAMKTPVLVTGLVLVITFLAAWAVTRQLKMDELRSDFLATIGHELKTPLASSQVLLETLAEGKVADEKAAGEYYELLLKENERLRQLVENFMTFHRLEQAHAFEKASVSPWGAVEDAMAISGPRAENMGGRVTKVDDKGVGPETMQADRSALVTALVCLIENGLKYSEGRPEVEVGCGMGDEGLDVVFEVKDRGIGIPREAGERVFERFFQGDEGLNRRHGGCGLGLAIARAIAVGHGGTIGYEGREGGGTCFFMRIPCG